MGSFDGSMSSEGQGFLSAGTSSKWGLLMATLPLGNLDAWIGVPPGPA